MKLLFSEAPADYRNYIHPYAIWALPESGERPGDLMHLGFLPSSPDLDRFYLCRNLRVELDRFQPSSENRRILRKGEGLTGELVARKDYAFTKEKREAWKAYADARFGEEVMSTNRFDRLMNGKVVTHLLRFSDSSSGHEVGTVLLYLEPPRVAYYYYAFYDLAHPIRSLGLFMMTWTVGYFARQGINHLHLGTCYSDRALYKTQFLGTQFFNGFRWSENLDELKSMLQRDRSDPKEHLLEDCGFLSEFYPELIANLAGSPSLHVQLKPPQEPRTLNTTSHSGSDTPPIPS